MAFPRGGDVTLYQSADVTVSVQVEPVQDGPVVVTLDVAIDDSLSSARLDFARARLFVRQLAELLGLEVKP